MFKYFHSLNAGLIAMNKTHLSMDNIFPSINFLCNSYRNMFD